jgi:very-short-patch-repair endonuclease
MDLGERTPPRNGSELLELAADQDGVFSREQALAAGLTPSALSRRVAKRVWERVMPGVYGVVGSAASLRRSAMAAALWAGDGSVVSLGTAGVLWGIEGARSPKGELWVPLPRDPRHHLVVVHRGSRVDRADRTTLGAIPITTPVRTLIDLSARMEDDQLLSAMEHAIRRRLVSPQRLAARLTALRSSGRPGAGRLEDLLVARTGPSLESTLEAKVWLLVQRTGLPLPQRQHWISLAGGRYRLDFAWPEHRVGLECDGWEHHGRRSAFVRDRARLAELAAARWHVLPVTWHAVTKEPKRVERWLRSVLPAAA